MKTFTLCFLLRGEEVLLARKRHGHGAGKWKGYGGKVRKGESFRRAASRKLFAESGLYVEREHWKRQTIVITSFDGKPQFRFIVFTSRKWRGTPQDTDEMHDAQWFSFKKLPLKNMWKGDREWLPGVLAGKPKADVHIGRKSTPRRKNVFELSRESCPAPAA